MTRYLSNLIWYSEYLTDNNGVSYRMKRYFLFPRIKKKPPIGAIENKQQYDYNEKWGRYERT